MRVGFADSRRSGDVPDFGLRGEDGRAIDTQQIFSGGGTDYTPLFRALIVQRHRRALSDDEFLQLLKAHVDHGFQLIKNDTAGLKSEDDYVDYLIELTRAGLEQRTQGAAPQIEATPAFGGLIELQVGYGENDRKVNASI